MPSQSVTWNPLVRQEVEPDTIYLLDTAVEKTLTPGLGGLMMGDGQGGEWTVGSKVVESAGRFRTGLKSTSRAAGFLCMPMTGLLPANEFTIEWWVNSDTPWLSVTDNNLLGLMEDAEGILVYIHQGFMRFTFAHEQDTGAKVQREITYDGSARPANQWVNLALTYLSNTLKLYVDGVLQTTLTSVAPPRVWSDSARQNGLCIGGANGKGGVNFTISDLRISRKARVPSGTQTVDDFNDLTVTPGTTTGKTVQKNLLGGLLTLSHDAPAATAAMATNPRGLNLLRTGKLISTTPIKAGGTDATHPTAGISGSYSYDWRVVDHTIDYFTGLGMTPYIDFDAAPQILGGTTAPYSGSQLTDTGPNGRSDFAEFPPTVPNNFVEFGKICRDLVHYITVTKGVSVPYWTVWNETDTGGFWAGNLTQYLALFKECSAAVKAVNPALKVGGAEFVDWNPTWAESMIQYAVANSVALDFISWHYYKGKIGEIAQAKNSVARWAAQYGLSPVPEILVGEWCWTNTNFPQSTPNGPLPWRNVDMFTNDWHASWAAASLIEMQAYGVPLSVYTSPVAEDGVFGAFKDGVIDSWEASGLMSQTNPWANLNVFRQWNRLPANVVSSSYTGLPGIFTQASKDSSLLSLFIANCRYRKGTNASVTVHLPTAYAGQAVQHFVVDDQHSNARDAGLANQDLQSVTPPTIAGDGTFTITMRPRSVSLLEIGVAASGDTTPPDTTITSAPADGPATTVSFSFTTTEPPGTFEAQMDGAGFVAVTSPKSYSGLSVGSHTFQVRARDSAGNVDATPASHTWNVTTPPPPPSGGGYDSVIDADSPIAHWKLGETSGTTATDRKGTYSGTYTGNVTLGVAGAVAGESNTAVTFRGPTDPGYVTLPAVPLGTNASVEAWFKTGSSGRIFSWYHTTSNAHLEVAVTPRVSGEALTDTSNFAFADGPFGKDDSTWHHVCLTKAGTALTLYVDGASVATATLNGALTVNSARIAASVSAAAPSYFNGQIDEVAAYSTTLSAARVTAHYNAGLSPPPPATDTTPPDTTITVAPTSGTTSTTATFEFTANEAATFEVQIDGGGFSANTSPKSYPGLAAGTHTFQVRAIDTAGNVDPTPATHTWTIATSSGAAVTNEELWLTDSRIGIVMNQAGVDQGAKLQQAISLALSGDGVLRLNPGVVENHSVELTYSRASKTLHIIGNGAGDNDQDGSVIKFPVDLGDGKYAFKLLNIESYGVHWENFTLRGPFSLSGIGSTVANMWGPRLPGRSRLRGITSTGFKAGVQAPGDHHEFYECHFKDNGYGMYAGDSFGMGLGDFWAVGCYFDGNKRASWGIGTSQAIANFTIIQGHSGFSPYGIYRFEEGGTQRRIPFLLGGDFIQHSWEACGNCVICDEPGDGYIVDVRFANIGEAGEPTLFWGAKPRGAGLWDLGGIDRVTVHGDVSPWFDTNQGFDLPWLYAHIGVSGLQLDSPDFVGHRVYDNNSASNHHLVYSPFIDNIVVGHPGARGGRGINATVVTAGENLARFDAVELTDNGKARRARNTNPYLGQVLQLSATTNDTVYVITNGAQTTWIQAKVSQSVRAGDRLVVDPANPGKLRKGPSFSYDVVARATADIAAGATGPVKIINSQAS